MDLPAALPWLLLGGGLQLFGFGRWMTPLAAWLAPVFVLHFAHAMPPVAGMLWIWLAMAIAMGISLRGIVPIPGVAYLVLPVAMGFFASLPFLVDRLVAPLVPGFWATLVFPVAWTATEFLDSRWNPYGTWGATGYTQHGVLPLMQLASVTGVWGIGFLIGWFAGSELGMGPAVCLEHSPARRAALCRGVVRRPAVWRAAHRVRAGTPDGAHCRHRLAERHCRTRAIHARGRPGHDGG